MLNYPDLARFEVHFSKVQKIRYGIHLELALCCLLVFLNHSGFYAVWLWRRVSELARRYYGARVGTVVWNQRQAVYSSLYAPSDSGSDNSSTRAMGPASAVGPIRCRWAPFVRRNCTPSRSTCRGEDQGGEVRWFSRSPQYDGWARGHVPLRECRSRLTSTAGGTLEPRRQTWW